MSPRSDMDHDNMSPPPPYSAMDLPRPGRERGTYDTSSRYYYSGSPNRSAAADGVGERTPLVYRTIVVNASNQQNDHKTVSRIWMWVCLTLAVTCIVAVAALFTQISHAHKLQHRVNALNRRLEAYPPTRAELDELQHNWEVAKAAHEEESKTWSDARAGFDADKERWAKARNDHYSVRVHEGNRLGLSWNGVQSHQCVAYGTRAYSAHLEVNKEAACRYMPLTLGGEFVDQPHECYSEYDDYRGVWGIGNDVGCQPNWGKMYDKGCVGGGSGKHRYEARLWNIHGDWMTLCVSTPHDINGQHFERPTYCQNRGPFFGMVGMWDVNDYGCL